MSQLTLTGAAKPIFLSGNFLTRYAAQASDLVVSSGTSLSHRLYDMDPAGQWAGETASDAADETIEAGLWLPGLQSLQDVDFLAVLGHNLKAFDIELSDDNGASYPPANKQTYTLQAANYTITSLAAAIEADKFKITAHTTQTANQLKLIGSIVLAEALLQMPVGMSLFQPHPLRVKTRSARMYNNSTRRSFIDRSDASFGFHDFSVGFRCLTKAQADALEAVLLRRDPIIFYPEPGTKPANMYQGQVVPGTYTREPTAGNASLGETVAFDFEETDGA
jgi:hypothetical protein